MKLYAVIALLVCVVSSYAMENELQKTSDKSDPKVDWLHAHYYVQMPDEKEIKERLNDNFFMNNTGIVGALAGKKLHVVGVFNALLQAYKELQHNFNSEPYSYGPLLFHANPVPMMAKKLLQDHPGLYESFAEWAQANNIDYSYDGGSYYGRACFAHKALKQWAQDNETIYFN